MNLDNKHGRTDMTSNHPPLETPGFRGGVIAALLAFALTWFLVNGSAAIPSGIGSLNGQDLPLCAVSVDKPTSRFLEAPIISPVPWYGG